jgi:hypothetical protein
VSLILVVGCLVANGATYYVDQTAGNDSSTGTSPTAPWKNCPGMSGTAAYTGSGSLAAGDTVNFDKGDTWQVSSGSNGGLYLVGGVHYVGNGAFGTGTKAIIRANGACEAGVVRFRDHPTVATVFEGFQVDANGQVTNGVDINTAFWQLMNGATKRVKDCEVHHTWSRTSLNQYRYGIIVSNHGGTGGYAENVEIINCIVHDTSRDALCLYPGDENGNCRIKNITVRGCEVYNTGQDPDYGAGSGILVKGYVQDATIEYNYVHDTKGALMFVNGNETNHFGVGPTNIHIRYNIFNGATGLGGAILIYDGASGQDPKDLKVYGNIVYNNHSLGGIWLDSGLGNTLHLLLYNNTFYNAPVIINNSSATVTAFEFKNNIVYYTGGVPLQDPQGKITSHSGNIFYRNTGTLVSSGGTNYSSGNLASYEPSASSGNPLFKNTGNLPTGFTGTYGTNLAPNSDGLSLQQTSYGIGNGTTLVSPYNGSINTVTRPPGGGWDIGAYQHQAAVQVPAPTNLRIL